MTSPHYLRDREPIATPPLNLHPASIRQPPARPAIAAGLHHQSSIRAASILSPAMTPPATPSPPLFTSPIYQWDPSPQPLASIHADAATTRPFPTINSGQKPPKPSPAFTRQQELEAVRLKDDKDTVTVIGYPLGRDTISVTKGVVGIGTAGKQNG